MANENRVFVVTTGIVRLLPEDFDISTVTDIDTPIPDAKDLGLIGEDGVTVTPERTIEEIKILNHGATVKRMSTDASILVNINLVETNEHSDSLIYGSTRDQNGRIEWRVGTVVQAPIELVFTTKHWGGVAGSKTYVKRLVLSPNTTVDEVGEVSYVHGEATVYPLTFKASNSPDSDVTAVQIEAEVQEAPTPDPDED